MPTLRYTLNGDYNAASSYAVGGVPSFPADTTSVSIYPFAYDFEDPHWMIFSYFPDYLYEELERTDVGGQQLLMSDQVGMAFDFSDVAVRVQLSGGDLGDLLRGGSTGDFLDGGAGADTVTGGGGDDVVSISLNATQDSLDGGTGFDTLRFQRELGSTSANVRGASITDFERLQFGSIELTVRVDASQMAGITHIDGDGGDGELLSIQMGSATTLDLSGVTVTRLDGERSGVSIAGDADNEWITGSSVSDTIMGGGGRDTMAGGRGDDVYTVDSSDDVVIEAANAGIDAVRSSATFTLAGGHVERLTLTGSAAIKGTGNDLANVIVGNGAKNSIIGGLGNDTLTGGGGDDIFLFNRTPHSSTNADVITDFAHSSGNDDSIRLDDAAFQGLTEGRQLAANQFYVGTNGAHDADDRIIYNATTGALYFDRDGSGAGYGAVKFAVIANHIPLTAADFLIV